MPIPTRAVAAAARRSAGAAVGAALALRAVAVLDRVAPAFANDERRSAPGSVPVNDTAARRRDRQRAQRLPAGGRRHAGVSPLDERSARSHRHCRRRCRNSQGPGGARRRHGGTASRDSARRRVGPRGRRKLRTAERHDVQAKCRAVGQRHLRRARRPPWRLWRRRAEPSRLEQSPTLPPRGVIRADRGVINDTTCHG